MEKKKIQQEEYCFRQHKEIKFKEETSSVLHFELATACTVLQVRHF